MNTVISSKAKQGLYTGCTVLSGSEEAVYKVRVGEKEVTIDEEVLGVLKRYVHTEMTLEQLADKLGLESWEEAYEFVKNIPAWILWIPPTLWKTMKTMKTAKEEMMVEARSKSKK